MNTVVGYYLMPHPPIVIPEIGKSLETKINGTKQACELIADEIKEKNVETIVVITPHGPVFSDAIAISDAKSIKGDLSQFGAKSISFEQSIDQELVEVILNDSKIRGIQTIGVNDHVLKQFNTDFNLDHGSTVPLYFINEKYKNFKLVHITYGFLSETELYEFGMVIQDAIKRLGRKSVIIASGDLSHRLLEEGGAYSYSPSGKEFDQTITKHLQEGDVEAIFDMNANMIEAAGECGLRSIYIMLGTMAGKSITGDLLSYEGTFGVGYAVMRFNRGDIDIDYLNRIKEQKKEQFRDKLEHSDEYVKLARESLHYFYKHKQLMEVPNDLKEELVNNKNGVFVSLKKAGQLRGCIGTILPTMNNVAEEIIRNAVEAAVKDPRFNQVEEYELLDLDVSVDVIMAPVPASRDELNPKQYGVIVSHEGNGGVLLPDLEGVNSVEQQLEIVCQKAGIDKDSNYNIEKFEVVRHIEGEL
ncbi:AmmeMemoRadiSam system protein A [Haloplasma contractile]|uniref:Catalytic LigB subunit of aromatic ring-opening dioxygenase protein n=1 Tax=Haloplasma contractile SSD-17B TaxID=1033810 RepID=U2E7K5_9MOLU|nr:AmmeMemoRadiSam system protein A [Haloplasma contractile]ERJ11183.1 Catalytic LigB subunit of aromatic ring-opening dioxygenase protein [Haloplasma contractile SSD-17B]